MYDETRIITVNKKYSLFNINKTHISFFLKKTIFKIVFYVSIYKKMRNYLNANQRLIESI